MFTHVEKNRLLFTAVPVYSTFIFLVSVTGVIIFHILDSTGTSLKFSDSVVDRHRFDADPDTDFHFDDDSHPDLKPVKLNNTFFQKISVKV
jgi:hypothetical protein